MGRNKNVILPQCRHSFHSGFYGYQQTHKEIGEQAHLSTIRWMKGFCFPGLGGESATWSIESVQVAVNRHVWRSFGRTLNKCDNSGTNVGVRSLSASSSTFIGVCKGTFSQHHKVNLLTRNLTLERFQPPLVLRRWSTIRPGVAMTTCGLLSSSKACDIMSIPPTTTAVLTLRTAPKTANCSAIWKASSLDVQLL